MKFLCTLFGHRWHVTFDDLGHVSQCGRCLEKADPPPGYARYATRPRLLEPSSRPQPPKR